MLDPRVSIPMLAGERAERYAARVAYMQLGAARSLVAVGRKLGKSRVLMERWSAEDGWAELARRYDETLAGLAAAEDAERYRADVAAHRKRAQDTADALYTVAGRLLKRLNAELDTIELGAGALSIVRASFETSLDISAHCLGVDILIARLEGRADD